MSTITIPKHVTKGAELIVLSREEYQRLLAQRTIPEYEPTAREKKALTLARKNRASGNYLTLHELKQKLRFTD